MSDPYAIYVATAYGATAAILGLLVWSTVRANARVRGALERAERERRR